MGVSVTLYGAKDERRAAHDGEKAREVGRGNGEGRHPREVRREMVDGDGKHEGNRLSHVISWGYEKVVGESGRGYRFLLFRRVVVVQCKTKYASMSEKDKQR